jgi:hypothetical protein
MRTRQRAVHVARDLRNGPIELCEDLVVTGQVADGAHETIRRTAANGEPAWFVSPDKLPEELPTDDDDGFWFEHRVDARWLADFLTDPGSLIHRRGVTIVGARISGVLDLEGAEVRCALALIGCHLGDGEFNLTEAQTRSLTLTRSRCAGLRADGAEIVGDLVLNDRFEASSEVRLPGATIAGNLICSGARLSNPGRTALDFGHSHIAGDAILNDGFQAAGQVRLGGATIGGSLKCRQSVITNPGGDALRAEQIHVARTVFLDQGFRATGTVRLLLASIGGDLDCTGGTFINPGRHALLAPSARIAGSVWLNSGFCAEGAVILVGDNIGGDLDCNSGRFQNPQGAAIRAERAQIGGAVNLSNGFEAVGEVRLHGASIGRHLDCSHGTFTNPDGQALAAKGTQVAGEVFVHEGFSALGVVSFRRASVAALVDDQASWPQRTDLVGFRYEQLHSPDRGWRKRKEWLRHQAEPSPEAYIQLASVYRATGDEYDARKILMERHNVLLDPPAHWNLALPRSRRWWRRMLRYTIGHGYEPWRVLAVALPLLVGMSLWYSISVHDDLLVPDDGTSAQASTCNPDYTCVQPFVYALDSLIPLVDLGQRSKWVPDQSHREGWLRDGRWLAAATWVTTALGWVFATLVAASFTQVVRRE